MCKDKHWEGVKDEMFETRVRDPCCLHLLPIYRLIAFLFLIQTIVLFEISIGGSWYTQLAFLTIWGEILTIGAFGGLLCLTPKACRQVYCHRCCYRFVHTIYNLALTLGMLIFIIFWAALSPYLFAMELNGVAWWFQIQLHFITQMLILIDFILCDIFFHKWQYLVQLTVGIAYLIVNAVVTLTAFIVYPILTWREVMTAVWVVVCFGIATGAFFLFWWLGQKKLKRRQSQVNDEDIRDPLMRRPAEE